MNGWIGTGALYCALAVAAGAFGAHGLKARLDPPALALWETAARYLMYGGLGLMLLAVGSTGWARPPTTAVWLLAAGTALFFLTVAALALGGPRWLGIVTPLGGLWMIAGFAIFAIMAWRQG